MAAYAYVKPRQAGGRVWGVEAREEPVGERDVDGQVGAAQSRGHDRGARERRHGRVGRLDSSRERGGGLPVLAARSARQKSVAFHDAIVMWELYRGV